MTFRLLTLIFFSAWLPTSANSLTFEELKDYHQKNTEEIELTQKRTLLTLQSEYRKNLKLLLNTISATGALEDALLVKAEISRLEKGETKRLEDSHYKPLPKLNNLRDTFDRTTKLQDEQTTAKKGTLDKKYVQLLKSLKVELTRERNFDRAIEVNTEITKFSSTDTTALPSGRPLKSNLSPTQLAANLADSAWEHTTGAAKKHGSIYTFNKGGTGTRKQGSLSLALEWSIDKDKKLIVTTAAWKGNQLELELSEDLKRYKGNYTGDKIERTGKRLKKPTQKEDS